MTYTPSTPANGAENISISQPKITTNFEQLNTLYNRDHFAWNDLTSGKRGYHRQMSFPDALVADPAIGSFDGILYPKEDPNDTSARTQMFFRNTTAGGRVFQITNRFIDSSQNGGYLMLPNGTDSNRSIIIMWGFTTISGGSTSGQKVITLPTINSYTGAPAGFPGTIFNVQFSIKATASADVPKLCIHNLGFSNSSFTIRYSSNGAADLSTIYWFAIGN